MSDFTISSKSFNECVKKYSNGEYCYDSESKITGFRKVADNSEMPEEEYDDFTEGFFKYIIDKYDLGNVEIEYWDVSASDEDEIIFVYSIIMGKDTVSKEYYYSEFQKLVEKLMPGYHIGTSDVDESIIFFSTIYGVDDYECLEILKQRLRNELAAREVIEIEYNAFNHTYTVIYEKITDEFVRENIIGKYTARVVGTQFENRPENHSELRKGESVKLVREPDNSYDANAISVRTLSDLELGHLPAEIAGDISAYIDNDFVVVEKAVVSHTKAFTKSGTLMKRPELEIEFYLQSSAIRSNENSNDANNAFDELNANLNEFQENPDEKTEEIREKYRPDHFLEEMKSNPGYTMWAAFEFALAALSDTMYDQNIISNAEKALESDEYINTLNIDLFGLMIYSRALGDEGSEMTREFLKSLVAAATEKSDKSDLIDLMNKLREKVVINKISFLEISKIVSSVLKLDNKTNSDTNGNSSINTFSESISPKSAEKVKITEEFEIEGTVLKEYLGKSKTVKIPDGITKISRSSFFNTSFVEKIEFPQSIQRLEYNPFKNTNWYINIKDTLVTAHDNIIVNFPVTEPRIEFPENTKAILLVSDTNKILTDVSIPTGVKVLGPIFSDFKKLQNVTLAEGTEELYGTFAGCSKLNNVTLPSTIKKLDWAFHSCFNLKSIEMPDGLMEIEESSFSVCKKLTLVKLNNGLKTIGGWAFFNCISLKSIELPSSLEKLGTCAFSSCTALTNVKVPYSITKLERGTFSDCVALTSIELPDSIKEIKAEVFKGCTALESVVLPNGLKKIESDTFRGCVKLKHIVIPASLEKIDDTAFIGCTALKAAMRKKGYDTKNITAGSLKSFFSNDTSENKTNYFPSPKEEETIASLKIIVETCDKMEALKKKMLSEAPKEYLQVMDGIDEQIGEVIAPVKEISAIKDDNDALLQFIRDNKTQDFRLLEDTLRGLCTQMDEIYNSYSPIWNKEKSENCNFNNASSSSSANSNSSKSSGGCYVATCVYGSYDCPQVWTLRRFRDYTLAKTWYGRLFIKTYYAISPHIVKVFGKTQWFNNLWKPVLDRMVNHFRRKGISDTRYDDLNM